MKTKNLFKGLLTVCVLFIGLSVNATLGEITVWGYTSYDGEPMSDVVVRCSNSQEVTVNTDIHGFYQLNKVKAGSSVSFSRQDLGSKSITISSNDGLSQNHDVDFASSSSSNK